MTGGRPGRALSVPGLPRLRATIHLMARSVPNLIDLAAQRTECPSPELLGLWAPGRATGEDGVHHKRSCPWISLRLRQGVRRGISVGRHVIRRRNPRPDPNCQVADNEQRRRGLQPRTGGQELTAERAGNPLSRIRHGLLSMRGRRQQNGEEAEDCRECRFHGLTSLQIDP